MKEINKIHHLAYAVLSPIIELYITHAKRPNIQLLYEKTITSNDGTTGGEQEVVAVDVNGIDKEEYIFVVGGTVKTREQETFVIQYQ